MQRDVTAHVLIAVGEGVLRDAMASTLDGAGYVVLRAGDAEEAIGLVRRSLCSMVVLVGLDCLDLLASVVSDRRLSRHHAYVVLLPEGSGAPPRWVRCYPQLALSVLALPLDAQALLAGVACAACGRGIVATG